MQGNQLLWSAAWLVCFRQFKVPAISPRPFGIGDRLIKAPTTQKFAAIPTNCRQLQWIISAAYSSPLFLFFQKLTFLEKYCGRPEGRDSVCMCVCVCVCMCVCVCLSVCLSEFRRLYLSVYEPDYFKILWKYVPTSNVSNFANRCRSGQRSRSLGSNFKKVSIGRVFESIWVWNCFVF